MPVPGRLADLAVVQGLADLNNRQFLPTEASTENYEQILPGGSAADLFMPALRNSIGISLIATLIAVVLAMFAAYAIARLDFPGKRLILTSALAVAIFPVVSIVTRCSTCGATSVSTTPGPG